MKNEGARVITLLNFTQLDFGCSKAANSVVGGPVRPKLNLVQAFMIVLVNCKNEEDPFKNEGAGVVTTDIPF